MTGNRYRLRLVPLDANKALASDVPRWQKVVRQQNIVAE